MEKKGFKIKPQKSEIDGIVWLSEAVVKAKIKRNEKITPDGVK